MAVEHTQLSRFRSYSLAALFALFALVGLGAQEAGSEASARVSGEAELIRWSRTNSVSGYLIKHQGAARPEEPITIPASSFIASGDGAVLSLLDEFRGTADVLSWKGERGWVEWEFLAPETGFYFVSLDYMPLPGKGQGIEFSLYIDGTLPFADYESVFFPRIWKDATAIPRDELDNELKPNQEEVFTWTRRDFIDTQGFYNKSMPVYISAGTHRLRLQLRRENIALSGIRLHNDSLSPSYAEYIAAKKASGLKPVDKGFVKVQAEHATLKSDSTLSGTYDRSDAATEPSHPAKIRLNTMGGSWSWKLPGQWLEWEVEAPEEGLYTLYFKGRQNFQRGMAAVRTVSINGEIPFEELSSLEFPYGLKWRHVVPRSKETGEPYLVHLKKGRNTIRLEGALGPLSSILTEVDDLTYEINTLRRRFIMIMGAEPDIYRDYNLDKEIPGLIEKLDNLSIRFTQQADEFERITGQKGSEAAQLRVVARQLAEFASKPEDIKRRQTTFRDNIAALAQWILYRKEVALEMDYLGIAGVKDRLPSPTANFIQQMAMGFRSFLASFVEDYNSIGAQHDEAVVVWTGLGRDQTQILRELIINDFTPKTGIKINLSLVQAALIEATLAGRGPEISIGVSRGLPINFAARNALYDLASFEDFDEVASRFSQTAMVPYTLQGGVYGLPLTQDFHLMFYRTDVFRELGLQPPETWEDINRIIPVLQRNNMQFGLPYQAIDAMELIDAGMGARNIFPTLLSQYGGNFYNEDFTKSGLNSPEAYKAFKMWTDFYAAYGFDLKYDFYTRFRTGELPIGLASYPVFNQLNAAAPEIRNEWEMVPIPGTRKPDGSIDRSEAASGSATIMFKGVKNPEAAWTFLKWWTSAETQTAYGRQVETMLGVAARWNTANVAAFNSLPWSREEAEMINAQRAHVKEVPEIPGGYYTIRMLDTAFTRVLYDNMNPRATLFKYTEMINEELMRKRKELGLYEE